MQTRRLVLLAILLGVSVVLNIVERVAIGGLTGLPMVRLGLANIVILIVLYLFTVRDALTLLLLRIFLVGLFTALFSPTFWLSLGGGVLAFTLMVIFKKIKVFSVISVSVMGSFGHAVGQILTAIFILSTQELITYLPVLIALSIPTGVFTGLISKKLIQILEHNIALERY